MVWDCSWGKFRQLSLELWPLIDVKNSFPLSILIIFGRFSSNKNIKMSSFKSSENIQKKEDGPDISVSDNQSSSVTLTELEMKARKGTVISSFSKEVIQ